MANRAYFEIKVWGKVQERVEVGGGYMKESHKVAGGQTPPMSRNVNGS